MVVTIMLETTLSVYLHLTNEFEVSGGIGAVSGFILKHGLSSNKGISDKTNENLQARGVTIFDGEILTLTESSGITVIRHHSL